MATSNVSAHTEGSLDAGAPVAAQTPFALLPPELLLDVLSLCQTSPHLPASSRACSHGFFVPGAQPHRVWSHRHVFLDPRHDPKAFDDHEDSLIEMSQELNEWHPRVAQIDSHLAYYLKARVPADKGDSEGLAAGIAPPPPDADSALETALPSVLSKNYVEWLFCKSGPFGSLPNADTLDVVAQLTCIRGSPYDSDDDTSDGGEDDEEDEEEDVDEDVDEDDEDEDEAEDEAEDEMDDGDDSDSDSDSDSEEEDDAASRQSGRSASSQPAPSWRFLPDALLLAHFFIRTTQLRILEVTLTHLRRNLPAITTTTAPFSTWSHLLLDNRAQVRHDLSAIVSEGDPVMTYPTLLCCLALLDWSKPALDVVVGVFGNELDLVTTANLITGTHRMFSAMAFTLDLLTSPPSTSSRVLSVLNWLQQHDAYIHLERFPTLAHHIRGSYPIFADVFLLHDLGNLPFLFDNPSRFALGDTLATWVTKGHPDLLHLAIEHNLLSERALSQVLRYAADQGDSALVATIAVNADQSQGSLEGVVLYALKVDDADDPETKHTYVTLLNLLTTYGHDSTPSPTDLIVSHSRHWPARALAVMLFDCPMYGLLVGFDYSRILHQHLQWATSWTAYRTVEPSYLTMACRLIDQCIVEGFDWDALPVDRMATACAMRLIGFWASMRVDGQIDQAKAESPVAPDAMACITQVLMAALGSIESEARQGCAPGEELAIKPFSQWIPADHRDVLLAAIMDATTFTPSTDGTFQENATDEPTSLSWFLDMLIVLDSDFVLKSIPWTNLATVSCWPRFQRHQLACHVTPQRAVGLVRSALESGNTGSFTAIVKGLADEVRESDVFLRGLAAILASYKPGTVWVSAAGSLACNWGGWERHLARFFPLPEDDETEDECDGDAFIVLFD